MNRLVLSRKGGYGMKFITLKKETVLLFFAVIILGVGATVWFLQEPDAVPVFTQVADENVREIDMITAEFKTKTNDGKDVTIQRWDPGTVYLEKDEKVNLYITVVNDEDHPFYIEGTNIHGIAKKGEQTLVPLQFDKEGTYRLICETHAHRDHTVPMIAYIVVD